MSEAAKSYLVHQFIPLICAAVFGIGLIHLAYSLALPA